MNGEVTVFPVLPHNFASSPNNKNNLQYEEGKKITCVFPLVVISNETCWLVCSCLGLDLFVYFVGTDVPWK